MIIIHMTARKRQNPDLRTHLTAKLLGLRSWKSSQIIYWKQATRCRLALLKIRSGSKVLIFWKTAKWAEWCCHLLLSSFFQHFCFLYAREPVLKKRSVLWQGLVRHSVIPWCPITGHPLWLEKLPTDSHHFWYVNQSRWKDQELDKDQAGNLVNIGPEINFSE